MKKGYLSEYFNGIGYKYLSAVEADRHRSNQHEFDGVAALKLMLGDARMSFDAMFIYLSDDDSDPVTDSGFLTWYDARENHPTRSEYRLYFPETTVSRRASEGDLLVIGRRPDSTLVVIIAAAGSTCERQVKWLFGLDEGLAAGYRMRTEDDADRIQLNFISRSILEQIGVADSAGDEDLLPVMLEKFGSAFPSTRVFSEFARSTVRDVSAADDPDRVLLAWMEQEENLFRTLERHLISDRLRTGFDEDVDAFIQFSLSVQNRRKSRAGSALENHLEAIFEARNIHCSRGQVTEGRSRPDFIFPGVSSYHDPDFPVERLTMLGVKSSCKDRWRQVLAEAARIDAKHLFTLEPSISVNQTSEMQSHRLSLVLPREVHPTYTREQQVWLMNLSEFVELVGERQHA